MHPNKKIEVEALHEQRWAKIEKSLFDQLDREGIGAKPTPRPDRDVAFPSPRSSRWRPAVALVMAGALAAAVGALATKSLWVSSLPVTASLGSSAPSRIVTAGSDSHVAIGESDVDVAPDSAVVMNGDDDRGILVVVDRGKVDCEVALRKGRPPFVVQAGEVRVRVVGTHFSVARDKDGDGAKVRVTHGVVEVTWHGQTVSLRDGESWPPPSTAPVAAAPVPVSEPKVVRLPKPLPKSLPAPTVVPPAAPPAPSNASPPPASTALLEPTPQERYESAMHMEGRDPDGAIAMFGKLASGRGPWAANALYESGRLQADRGRLGEARRLLGEYLVRYPNGANAADARDLLGRIR